MFAICSSFKCNEMPIIFIFVLLVSGLYNLKGQTMITVPDSVPVYEYRDMKGFYIGGVTGLAFGGGAGFFIKLVHTRYHTLYPIGTAVVFSVPTSLMGLGIGKLLSRHDTPFEGSFSVVGGYSSGPDFYNDHSSKRTSGFYFGLESPSIENWRYRLGTNYYFPYQTEAAFGTSRSNIWDVNLDLHYLVKAKTVDFYPIVGTSMLFDRMTIDFTDGSRAEITRRYLAANAGVGFERKIFQKTRIAAESRFAFYEQDVDFFFVFGLKQSL